MFSNNMVSFMSWVWNKRKQRNFALWKGPSDKSKYRPSLLLFFAYGGLPREKKFYGFERDLVLIQNINVTFDGRKETAQCKIFLAKRLVYLFLNWRHNSKPQTFFSKDNFPAKRLFLALTFHRWRHSPREKFCLQNCGRLF